MESVESNYTVTGGIRFETLVPERVLIIPNQDQIKNTVEFGIKVTNQTSTPYRFIFFSLVPEIISRGIQYNYAKQSMKYPETSDFMLAQPGESLTFLTKAHFFWRENKLGFWGRNLENGCWWFTGFEPVRYWVRFTYTSLARAAKIARSPTSWTFSEELWTGIVSSPYEEFYLEYPPD